MQSGKKVKHKQRDGREGEREGERKHRQNEKEEKRLCVHESDSGREMNTNVGMMSGCGLPGHGAMHDGNTSHSRVACL